MTNMAATELWQMKQYYEKDTSLNNNSHGVVRKTRAGAETPSSAISFLPQQFDMGWSFEVAVIDRMKARVFARGNASSTVQCGEITRPDT
jgi:ABC-type Mn2+/Zn2+ transport system ATPase subunit